MKIPVIFLLLLPLIMGTIISDDLGSSASVPDNKTTNFYEQSLSILGNSEFEQISNFVDKLIVQQEANAQDQVSESSKVTSDGDNLNKSSKNLRNKNQDKIILSSNDRVQIKRITSGFDIDIETDFENISIIYQQYLQFYKPEFLQKKGTDIYLYRSNVYMRNVKMINQFNSNPRNSYKMGLNPFTDIEDAQFGRYYKTPISKRGSTRIMLMKQLYYQRINSKRKTNRSIDQLVRGQNKSQPPILMSVYANLIKPPKITVSWRNVSGDAKFQGKCNACYAFGVLDTIYITLKIYNMSYEPFSVQQVVSCAILRHDDAKGCQGGSAQSAYFYANSYGVGPNSLYPYTMHDREKASQCNQTLIASQEYKDKKFLLPFNNVIIPNDCQTLVYRLKKHVTTSVIMGQYLQHYSTGVYKNPDPKALIDESKLDHLVVIVGYNHTDETYMFKNAWGPLWAMNGYGLTDIGTGVCLNGYYPIVKIGK